MAELPPNSAPESEPQPSAPTGLELACIGIMRSEFGRRPSRALDKAMMQLSAEQAWRENRVTWWTRIRGLLLRPAVGLGLAVAVAVAIVTWKYASTFFQPKPPVVVERVFACRVSDTAHTRWGGGSGQFKNGDILPETPLHLESGVVELTFASTAKVAVQGPAEFKCIDGNSLELRQGKLSAEVPQPAKGFSVHTPNATVVDLGTRFGLNARATNSSEVTVFEGKVRVAQGSEATNSETGWDLTQNMAMVLDERGGVTTEAASETSFPLLPRVFMIHPINCNFDALRSFKIGGFPSAFGTWSGPALAITGRVGDIKPAHGKGMLRFLPPPARNGTVGDSVVWQILDLRPARDFISTYGVVDLRAWVQFNRVPGDSHSATRFQLSIAAFHGEPADAPALWAARSKTAVGFDEKELETDNDPGTWQKLDVFTLISGGADFAVMEIRAIAPKDTPASVNPFPGHFADAVDAKVCVPLRATTTVSTH